MHRLKKWFGLSDWEGPSEGHKQSDSDPATLTTETDVSSGSTTATSGTLQPPASVSNMTKDNTTTTVSNTDADQSVIIDPVLGQNSGRDLSTRVDLWLRQYVPLEPDECLSCKLISMSVITFAMVFGVRATHRLKKFVHPRTRMWYKIGVLSSYGLAGSILYQRWFNTGFFEPAVEGEDSSERLERIFRADLNYYKNLYGNVKSVEATECVNKDGDE